MMQHARDEALWRMVEHSKSVGTNGVISAYFDSSESSDYMQEILAYRTAVVISKKYHRPSLSSLQKDSGMYYS
jgi:uncharacterized protein YbjQ (UPF0145 family)